MPEQLANGTTKGSVWYGLHFYPGVAEYTEPFAGRVLVNESTLRAMDPTFKGCPVFVKHVDEIEQDIDKLRGEADGWVIESFFNKADGKHWVQFLVTSEKGEEAIRQGYKLSNSYNAEKMGPGGIWNDVSYDAEVVEGNFEHLALVPVPRYNESVILSPEKYKEYCKEREQEIQRIANSGSKKKMALSIFKRTKVENGLDLENTLVVLPKSKKELSIADIVNAADTHFVNAAHGMAHPDHMVDMGDGMKMSVKDMHTAYKSMKDEAAKEHAMENDDDVEDVEEAHEDEPEATDPKVKKDKKDIEETEKDSRAKKSQVMGVRGASDEDDEEHDVDNAEEELAEKKVKPEKELPEGEKPKKDTGKQGAGPKQNASGKKKSPEQLAEEAQKRAEDKEKADRLRNASATNFTETAVVNFSMDRVSRGQQRYGSGR